VFFQGCPLSCWWCHNPEGQAQTHSLTSAAVSAGEIMKEIEKERIFFEESGGGVTFSGGEPLMQPDFLNLLLDECNERGIHTALDTSGYAAPEVFNRIIDKVDMFLYDIKVIDETLHKKFTSVSNKQILENLKTLSDKKKDVIIRFPLIPGLTDSDDNIKNIIIFLRELGNIKKIDILPYHKTADGKYEKYHLLNKMKELSNHDNDRNIEEVKAEFEANGFSAKIGG
jgi:pyruvate formate lyase activating enzyme